MLARLLRVILLLLGRLLKIILLLGRLLGYKYNRYLRCYRVFIEGTITFIEGAVIFIDKGSLVIGRLFKIARAKLYYC